MTIDTEPTGPDITLTSPRELVSAVPYLLGYTPTDSAVLVGVAERLIAVTARTDLPAMDEPPSAVTITAELLRRHGVDAAIIVGFGPPQRVTRCVDHLRALVEAEEIELIDAIRVTDGRYWSYLCRRTSCCPPEGSPVAAFDDVAAEFTLAGVQRRPDRRSIMDALTVAPEASRRAVATAIERFEETLDADDGLVPARTVLRSDGTALLSRFGESTHLPPPDQVARLAVTLRDPRVAAEAIALIDRRPRSGTIDLWLWLWRHLDGRHAAVPGALLAYAAWRAGNGIVAREAATRARAADPDCDLAMTIDRLTAAGLPPGSLPKIRKEALPC